MSESDKLDKITEKHFTRVVEIVVNVDNEFPTVYERMWAASMRLEIWKNNLTDAAREDD